MLVKTLVAIVKNSEASAKWYISLPIMEYTMLDPFFKKAILLFTNNTVWYLQRENDISKLKSHIFIEALFLIAIVEST